jgi:hypothetical protein
MKIKEKKKKVVSCMQGQKTQRTDETEKKL